jgi:hypothetical protein
MKIIAASDIHVNRTTLVINCTFDQIKDKLLGVILDTDTLEYSIAEQ